MATVAGGLESRAQGALAGEAAGETIVVVQGVAVGRTARAVQCDAVRVVVRIIVMAGTEGGMCVAAVVPPGVRVGMVVP